MPTEHFVKNPLDSVSDAFELCFEGGITQLVLGVDIRKHDLAPLSRTTWRVGTRRASHGQEE